MTTITTRPIIIDDSSTITQIDKERLVYNFNNINLLNVQKYNDSNLKIRGIQFYTTPSNNSVLKFKNINYIFSSYIITKNIDIIDKNDSYDYCLMIEFVTTTLSNKLILVLPINGDNQVGTDENNNNFVKDMLDLIINNTSDLTNSNNIVFNKYNDIDDNLKLFSPNSLIPRGVFYKYIFKDSMSKMTTFIVYPTTSSKIYADIPDTFDNTINSILNTTNTYTSNESVSLTSIYKHNKGAIKKDVKDTNLFEDIYIDCSPISDTTGTIIKQNKVFSLRNIFNITKTGIEKIKLSIDAAGNVIDNVGNIITNYSVDVNGNIVEPGGKIVNKIRLSIDAAGNVIDDKSNIMVDYSVDTAGNIVHSSGKIMNQSLLTIDKVGNVINSAGKIMIDYSVDSAGNIIDSAGNIIVSSEKLVNNTSSTIQEELLSINWVLMGIIFTVLICLSGYSFIKSLDSFIKISGQNFGRPTLDGKLTFDGRPKFNGNKKPSFKDIVKIIFNPIILKMKTPYIILTLLTSVLLLSGEKGKEVPILSMLVDQSQTGGVPVYPFLIIFGFISLFFNLKSREVETMLQNNEEKKKREQSDSNKRALLSVVLLVILYVFIMFIIMAINKLFSIIFPDTSVGSSNLNNPEKYISILLFTILIPIISIDIFKSIIYGIIPKKNNTISTSVTST